jgi:hypothetical protein
MRRMADAGELTLRAFLEWKTLIYHKPKLLPI